MAKLYLRKDEAKDKDPSCQISEYLFQKTTNRWVGDLLLKHELSPLIDISDEIEEGEKGTQNPYHHQRGWQEHLRQCCHGWILPFLRSVCQGEEPFQPPQQG